MPPYVLEAALGNGAANAAAPRGHAWSWLGGRRRAVLLGGVLPARPFRTTLQALLVMLVLTTFGAYVAICMAFLFLNFSPDHAQTAAILAAVDAVVVAFCWVPAYARQMALPRQVTYAGEVIQLLRRDGGEDAADTHHVWIDDGSPASTQFLISCAVYRRLSVGDLVAATWSPRRGRLRGITLTQAA